MTTMLKLRAMVIAIAMLILAKLTTEVLMITVIAVITVTP